MPESPSKPKPPRSRKVKIAAMALGLALGIACGYVPPDYRAACKAVTDITSIPSGCL